MILYVQVACVYVCLCTNGMLGAHGFQGKESGAMEPELHIVVCWDVGAEN
jgi:hypothetical protein